jgi:hypothetical protein
MRMLSSAIHQSTRLSASQHQRAFRLLVIQLRRSAWRTRSFATSSEHGRVDLTVFRNLMQWCRNTDSDIPLDASISPVTIGSPFVDEVALERLLSDADTFIWDLFPEDTKCDEDGMTIPLRNSTDIRNTIRAIYRMNAGKNVDDDTAQKRVAKAFETLKSLNNLSGVVAKHRRERALHLDRTGVLFRVGQVVQHKKARWRGVVIGWERIRPLPEGHRTSLTTKLYPTPEDAAGERRGDVIRYDVILDSSDAIRLLSEVCDENKHVECVFQSELDPITDARLCRIRHDPIGTPFDRYDCKSRSFVPKKAMKYEYPSDIEMEATDAEGCEAESLNIICSGISDAIQRFAARLESRILHQENQNECSFEILKEVSQSLKVLSSGNSFVDNKRWTSTYSPSIQATRQLSILHSVTWRLTDLLRTRRAAEHFVDSHRFRLGDVVQSKKDGIRGVVIGWFSESDVFWSIDDPQGDPMYRVVPDISDFKEMHGRDFAIPLAYECEKDLKKCPADRAVLNTGLARGWKKDKTDARYIGPASVRVGHDVKTMNRSLSCLTRHVYCHSSRTVRRATISKRLNDFAWSSTMTSTT